MKFCHRLLFESRAHSCLYISLFFSFRKEARTENLLEGQHFARHFLEAINLGPG